MANSASRPNIQVRLETEAPNPQFFLGKPGNRVELTRSEDGTAWTASIAPRLPADPIPFRLELGEAVGATWTLSIRSGDEEVYRTHGQVAAPTSKWIGEIHHAHTATQAAAPPRPPIGIRNETAYRVLITARESGGSTSALQLPPWGQRSMTADEAEALDLEPWTSRSIVRAGPCPSSQPRRRRCAEFRDGVGTRG